MIPTVDYIRILPELMLTVFGILIMLVDPVLPEDSSKKPVLYIALVGILASLAATVYQSGFYGNAFFDMVRVDAFSIFFSFVILLVALVTVLSSFDYLEVQRIKLGEYYALILFGSVGMLLMSSAIELVLIFIGIEISSIASRKRSLPALDSGLHFWVLRPELQVNSLLDSIVCSATRQSRHLMCRLEPN